MVQNDDDMLVKSFAAGDDDAFSKLYDRYWESLFVFAVRVLGDEEDAEDVVQDTFVALWRGRHQAGRIQSLKNYLFSIVRNNSLGVIQKKIRLRNYLESISNYFDGHIKGADEIMIVKGLQQFIDKKIETLPAKMREIFILSRKEHLSHQQIAQKLGISDETVKKQIYNSLKLLRKELDQGFYLTLFFLLHTYFSV